MRILLTGISGFFGSHLAKAFLNDSHTIFGIIRKSSDLKRIKSIQKELTLLEVDAVAIDSLQIDVLVHVATDYGRGKKLSEVLQSNLIWPLALIETLKSSNPQLTVINTDTFFNKGDLNYQYLASYTLSKKCFETAIQALTNETNVINMKLEHLYGPDDGPEKFIPHMINQLLKPVDSIDLTAGSQRRDFIYVEDAVAAYLKVIEVLAKLDLNYHQFGVGTGQSHAIKGMVELIKSESNNTETTLNWGALAQRPGEFSESVAINKSLMDLGWKPKYSLNEGIKETIAYYNQTKNGL